MCRQVQGHRSEQGQAPGCYRVWEAGTAKAGPHAGQGGRQQSCAGSEHALAWGGHEPALLLQATTGGGGWPMSVFLTPDLEPFFGGTYFPPKGTFGLPSFCTVLQNIAEARGQSVLPVGVGRTGCSTHDVCRGRPSLLRSAPLFSYPFHLSTRLPSQVWDSRRADVKEQAADVMRQVSSGY